MCLFSSLLSFVTWASITVRPLTFWVMSSGYGVTIRCLLAKYFTNMENIILLLLDYVNQQPLRSNCSFAHAGIAMTTYPPCIVQP